jgi:hypothetical protein
MKFVSEPYQGADSTALPTEELTMAEINKLGMAGQVPRLSPTWPNPRSARQNRRGAGLPFWDSSWQAFY